MAAPRLEHLVVADVPALRVNPASDAAVTVPIVVPLPSAATASPATAAGPRRAVPPLQALTTMPTTRPKDIVYRLALLDQRGRLAQQAVMTELGWRPGYRIDLRLRSISCPGDHAVAGVAGSNFPIVTVTPDPRAGTRIGADGHLRLPAAVRHRCRISAGDPVLLAADPTRQLLILYPPRALDMLLLTASGGVR
jgi:hypothetical protein